MIFCSCFRTCRLWSRFRRIQALSLVAHAMGQFLSLYQLLSLIHCPVAPYPVFPVSSVSYPQSDAADSVLSDCGCFDTDFLSTIPRLEADCHFLRLALQSCYVRSIARNPSDFCLSGQCKRLRDSIRQSWRLSVTSTMEKHGVL